MIVWAVLSIAGVSALIPASEMAFTLLKVFGAAVLVSFGVQALRNSLRDEPGSAELAAQQPRRRLPFRDGLITSLANPKLVVFFVALFPQFVGHRNTALTTTPLMAALIIVFDFVWYSALSVTVSGAKRRFERMRLARSAERLSGTILIGLGIRVAIEHR